MTNDTNFGVKSNPTPSIMEPIDETPSLTLTVRLYRKEENDKKNILPLSASLSLSISPSTISVSSLSHQNRTHCLCKCSIWCICYWRVMFTAHSYTVCCVNTWKKIVIFLTECRHTLSFTLCNTMLQCMCVCVFGVCAWAIGNTIDVKTRRPRRPTSCSHYIWEHIWELRIEKEGMSCFMLQTAPTIP